MTRNQHRLALASNAAVGLYWIALCVATHVPPAEAPLPSGLNDKLAHVAAYLVLAFLASTAWQLASGILTSRHLWFAWLVIVIYGALDELTQPLVGRDCSLLDWAADAVGAAAGIALFVAVRACCRKIHRG